MENILFSYIKMRKVTEGIHLTVADQVLSLRSSGDDPHAEAKDVTMTYEQTLLCRDMGRKLALSIIVQS